MIPYLVSPILLVSIGQGSVPGYRMLPYLVAPVLLVGIGLKVNLPADVGCGVGG